jgi:hypothetical protein
MTKVNLYALILTGASMISACHDHNADVNGVSPNRAPDEIKQVLLNTKQAWKDTAYFGVFCRDSLHIPEPIIGYTVRAEDLLAALNLSPSIVEADSVFKHIRVYIGYDKDSSKFKLFLVPVKDADLSGGDHTKWNAGRDILFDQDGVPHEKPASGSPHQVPATGDTDYVADLIAPCPNTCPLSGPANH